MHYIFHSISIHLVLIHEPPQELHAAAQRLLMLICHSSTNVDVCHTSGMFKCNSTPRLLLICHSSMTVDVCHTSVMLICQSMQMVVNLSQQGDVCMSQQVKLLFIYDSSTNVVSLRFPFQCISLNFQSSITRKRARHINPFWIKTQPCVPPIYMLLACYSIFLVLLCLNIPVSSHRHGTDKQ